MIPLLRLNRGEHRQSLARWLFFANQGEFRDGDYEEIMNKASCQSLISNAALVWNSIQIQRIADDLRGLGHSVRDEDLARIFAPSLCSCDSQRQLRSIGAITPGVNIACNASE
jgi:hypothetical protein